MMGLPGAGKTTVAEIIEDLTEAVRLSSDDARFMIWDTPEFSDAEHFQLYEYLDDQTKHLLEAGKSVIYDANLNRYIHRKEKYELAKQFGATCQLIWVKTPLELAKERRLEHTEAKLIPKGETSAQMFDRIAKVLEEPKEREPHITLDGTKITKEYVKLQLRLDETDQS